MLKNDYDMQKIYKMTKLSSIFQIRIQMYKQPTIEF